MKDCTGCELKERREAILAHPGWNTVTLGDKSVIMVFSAWGIIQQFVRTQSKPLEEHDICARCPGKRVIKT